MAITTSENDIKERLSVAYVTAVAAGAGCQVAKLDIDKTSIDAIVRPVSGANSQINLQLKATAKGLAVAEQIKISLPVKNYDDLRDTSGVVPHYLVVLELPREPERWLRVSQSELAISGVAYYGNLFGLPAVSNANSRVVTMPQSQRFDVSALKRMILSSPDRIGVAGA
jgi:Domain of unknown function (DUF4365)